MVNEVDEHVMETFGELDPNGKDAHEPGSKLDAGKNRLGLVLGGFSKALQEVGKVGTFGANKYTDNGWLEVPNGQERYTDAMLRHYFKEVSGEEKDEDSSILHAAHLAWNALARLELALLDSAPGKTVANFHLSGCGKGYYTDEETGYKFVEWPDDSRIDQIGQNGNNGEHYDKLDEIFRPMVERYAKQKEDEIYESLAKNAAEMEIKPYEDDFQE